MNDVLRRDPGQGEPPRARVDVRAWFRVVVAGLVLAALDVAVTFGRAFTEFLSLPERWHFALAAVTVGVASVAVFRGAGSLVARGVALRVDDPRRRVRIEAVLAASVAFVVGVGLAWTLTAGRRVRDLTLRPLLVVVAAAAFAVVVGFVVRSRPRAPSWRRALACFGVAVIAAVLDAFVLPRLYPAFHLGLAGLGVVAVAFGAGGIELPVLRLPARWVAVLVVTSTVVAITLAPLVVAQLSRSPNAGFVAQQRSYEVGKWVGLASRLSADESARPVDTGSAQTTRVTNASRGIDLRDRDFLLVTVDALRADRLRAYGGSGLTPAMDALAAEGAVFEHAYTPTPHTSYALASLLTGKFLRPVLELPDAPKDHPTLPELLRRYGYRTAAFYPPAIFFVDSHRFGSLADDGFGFEYRKEMFAPAHDRVAQVSSYLDDAPADRPVFVWVHLFEPHEPYEPTEAFRRGESAEQRYDGEVAAADAAFGELVRAFRAKRPNATVVLAADHGEEFGDHGGYYHGSSLYEEQVRIPLVWSSPGVVPPHSIASPVELVDLAPTVLAAVGIPADARMRGDDLGPVLASRDATGPELAFADLADARMITDGRTKVICRSESTSCSVYDLASDPRERRNLAGEQAALHDRFRGALYAFVASIPEVEAMAFAGSTAWPPALARAELGDASVGPEVVPLLGDARPEVRAASARALVKLRYAPAVRVLARLAENDSEPSVRAEANVARLVLGDREALEPVAALLTSEGEDEAARSLRTRAAFALGDAGDSRAVGTLGEVARRHGESEDVRTRAVVLLGTLRSRDAVPVLVEVLDDVRLRPVAARSLGQIGDRRAVRPLSRALAEERYVPAREAEATALVALGDRSVERSVRRFLGMETGLPGGVGLLLELGSIRGVRGDAGDLRGFAPTYGLACDARGCSSASDGRLPASAPRRGNGRIVVRVDAAQGAFVTISGKRLGPLDAGFRELSLDCAEVTCDRPTLAVQGEARVVAYVVVSSSPEIPAPPPVPWDGGVPDASGDPSTTNAPAR